MPKPEPEIGLRPVVSNLSECRNCGFKLEDVSNHMIDPDALEHIKEEHPDEIVDLINDVFCEVEVDNDA